jgi:hypothetical protein
VFVCSAAAVMAHAHEDQLIAAILIAEFMAAK